MKRHRNYKSFAPGAAVVYSGAIKELRQKVAELAAAIVTLPPKLQSAIDLLESGKFDAAVAAVVQAVDDPSHLVLAHCVVFLALLEENKLVEAMAEERVLEALSAEVARDVAKCYSISPEILQRLEDRVPPSFLQVLLARRSGKYFGAYIPATLDRAKYLAEQCDYDGFSRIFASMVYLVGGADTQMADVFAKILLHSTADAIAAGDVDDGCEGLELASKIRPHSLAVSTALGKIYQLLGRHERAIEAYEEAARLADPEKATERAMSLCAVGSVHLDRSEIGLAEDTYREALRISPALWGAVEGITVIDLQKRMTARLSHDGRDPQIFTDCAGCKERFSVDSFELRSAAFALFLTSDARAEKEHESGNGAAGYVDCPSCGVGLRLSGLKDGGTSVEIASEVRKVDDRQPWEWWLWKSEGDEPAETSFQVYRAL